MKQVLLAVAILGYASCDQFSYLPPQQRSPYSQPDPNQYSGPSRHSDSSTAPAQQVPILRLENDDDGEGRYSYVVETGDGIRLEQRGDATGDSLKVQGGFSYTAPDGQQIQVQYHADENGFQPQGDHLPTPPPIPEEIQKAVERNLQDEANGVVDDGQYRDEATGGASSEGAAATSASPSYGAGAGRAQYVPPARSQGAPAGNQGGYRY